MHDAVSSASIINCTKRMILGQIESWKKQVVSIPGGGSVAASVLINGGSTRGHLGQDAFPTEIGIVNCRGGDRV